MPSNRMLHPAAAVGGGTLVVGSLDAIYAIVFWSFRQVHPSRIFQSIAAGLLGRAAFEGGVRTAFLGLLLHYCIAFSIVTAYWLASRFLAVLTDHPVICGSVYGIVVYLVMNYVVIPLSAAGTPRFLLSWIVCSILVHALLIGVPAALFARAARRQRAA